MLVDHFFDRKMFDDEGAPGAAEGFTQGLVGGELEQGITGGFDIASRDNEAGFCVLADFVGTVEVVGNDGLARGERLGQGARDGFAVGEVDEAVHDAEILRNVGRLDEAGEGDSVGNAESAGAGFNLGTEGAITDKKEAGLRATGRE